MNYLNQIVAKSGSDTADLYIYEPIMWHTGSGGKAISAQLAALEGKYRKLRVFINSPGGSVAEGIAIWNLLQRTGMEVTIYVDGVAASMAAVLTQLPGAKVYMSRHAKLMIHNVKGQANGSSDEMRAIADLMDEFSQSLIAIISERTGITPEEVTAKYFDGKDHWLNAQQALEAKLITGITDGSLKLTPPKTTDISTLHTYYNQQIFNLKFNKMNLISKIFGLSEEVPEEQVVEKINDVLAQVTDLTGQITARDATIAQLQSQLDQVHQKEISEMIGNAVQAGKIVASLIPTYEKLAALDFEGTKAALNAIPAYQPISGMLNKDEIPEDRKGWSFSDWQAKDGKGLAKMKAEQPDVFALLYENQFGVKPKNQ